MADPPQFFEDTEGRRVGWYCPCGCGSGEDYTDDDQADDRQPRYRSIDDPPA